MKIISDLLFAHRPGRVLRLDLLLPAIGPAPLVVVIHGGGWREGSRKDEGLEWLVGHGYAIARIEYRFSREATFPAQLEDCLAALDWLRCHHAEYGFTDAPPGVVGTSAGGTLALLLATGGLVRAAVAYCAPCDFPLRAKSQPHLTDHPGGTVHDLLGGPVAANPALAAQASPARNIGTTCAPVLLIHGTADQQVLNDQPLSFLRAGLDAGADVSLITVPGAPHCGPLYHQDWVKAHVAAFLGHHVSFPALEPVIL